MDSVRIISREDKAFRDREEAGRLLAEALREWRGQHPLILGIPRGGLALAQEIAPELGGEIDVVLARKLRAPQNPEYAIGSMSEDGEVFADPRLLRQVGITQAALEREKQRVALEIEQRRWLYRNARAKVPLAGRVVIVTDDGLATGATMRAALTAARKESPKRLICAVPVGSEAAVEAMAALCDELVCLRMPRYFGAVGQFYQRFAQVEDDEVLQILRREGQRLTVG